MRNASGLSRLPSWLVTGLLCAVGALPSPGLTIDSIRFVEPADPAAVARYSKIELMVALSGVSATRMYEPSPARGGLDLSASFRSPGGVVWPVNGFWDGSAWRFRFSPDQTGTWTYAVAAQDAGGSASWSGGRFVCAASALSGRAVCDGTYLRLPDGRALFAVGHNTGWQYDVEQPRLAEMASRGESLLSFWIATPWAQPSWTSTQEPYWDDRAPIENTEQGIGNYNQAACAYIDGVVARAEAAGVCLLPTIWSHGQLRDVGHPWGAGWWLNNAYSRIGITASDFFRTSEASGDTPQWRYQKNYYRYLIARWGYSRSVVGWVAICEIDGTTGFVQNRAQAEAWCLAVRDYFRANDGFRRNAAGEYPVAFTKLESATWLTGLDTRATDSYASQNDPIGVASTIATETGSMRNSGKPSFHAEFGGNISGGATQPTHLHNGIWPGAAAGAAVTPLVWCDGGSFPMLTADMQTHLQYLSEFMAGVRYLGGGLAPATPSLNDANCRGWGMRLSDRGFVWVQNAKAAGGSVGGQTLSISGLLAGSYAVRWFDTWSSGCTSIRGDLATVGNDGNLQVTLPSLARADIACQFSRNSAPVASADAWTVAEDSALDAAPPGVLANDTDPDNDPLTAVLANPASHGVAAVHADGSFRYTPHPDFFGADSFTYTASDGFTQSTPTTVSITVTPVNDPPVARNDSAFTTEGVAVVIPVLQNDLDPEGDPLSVVALGPAANGSVSRNGDGSVTYTPVPNFEGYDTFTYKAYDGQSESAAATVSVSVSPANRPPVPANDAAATTQGTAVVIHVLKNDGDPDGDPLEVSGVTQGGHGSVVNSGNGSVTYTPNASFAGADTFTYTVSDGMAFAAATVTVTVAAVPSISGRIKTSAGGAASGVTLQLARKAGGTWIDQPGAVTDAGGFYAFRQLTPATYRVTPQPSGTARRFSPSSCTVAVATPTGSMTCNFTVKK